MSHVLMWRAADAGAAIAAHRIVKYGNADGKVVQSAAGRDKHVGVSGRGGAKDGERVEVARVGIADVEFGANVARGARLTADADGKAVPVNGPGVFQAVVAGILAADANIAVAGILRTDELIGVSATDGSAITNPSIHADGQIRSTGTTQNKHLIVTWRRPVSIIGTAEVAGAKGDIGQVLIAPGVY